MSDPTLFDLADVSMRMDRRPKRLRDMHDIYGQLSGGEKCGGCAHLLRREYAGTYFKCLRARITRGAATDWRARWTACGLYIDGDGPTE